MKHILLKNHPFLKVAFMLLFLCSISLAKAQTANDWTLHSTSNNVKFFYKIDVCSGSNALLLKFENLSADEKHLNYVIIVESPGSNIPLLPQFIVLKGNETKTGDCDSDANLKSSIQQITNPKLRVVLNVH